MDIMSLEYYKLGIKFLNNSIKILVYVYLYMNP